MRLEVLPDPMAVAQRAAAFISEAAREAVQARGQFLLAISGGHTPLLMLRALSSEDVPWNAVHIFQVDERVAPAGDADRNLTHLRESLLDRVPLPQAHLHAMPVERAGLGAAATSYAGEMAAVAGDSRVLDLIHLGLGSDGHTASLIPGDPVLDIADRDVAITATYAGRRRMTLTFPVLDRAREILWVITGREKAWALARLAASDRSIPAGRVRGTDAVVLTDADAAPTPPKGSLTCHVNR